MSVDKTRGAGPHLPPDWQGLIGTIANYESTITKEQAKEIFKQVRELSDKDLPAVNAKMFEDLKLDRTTAAFVAAAVVLRQLPTLTPAALAKSTSAMLKAFFEATATGNVVKEKYDQVQASKVPSEWLERCLMATRHSMTSNAPAEPGVLVRFALSGRPDDEWRFVRVSDGKLLGGGYSSYYRSWYFNESQGTPLERIPLCYLEWMQQSLSQQLAVAQDPGDSFLAASHAVFPLQPDASELRKLLASVEQAIATRHRDIEAWYHRIGNKLDRVVCIRVGQAPQQAVNEAVHALDQAGA